MRLVFLCFLFVTACSTMAPQMPLPSSGPSVVPTDIDFNLIEPPSSKITFRSAVNTFGAWQAVDLGFRMNVGIYAVNQEVAFLLGCLSVPAGTSQSALLRTNDGGITWNEVMDPVPANTVLEVNILANGDGWALLMWTVEDPGKITLFHTQDYGETWHKGTEIEKSAWYGYPIQMTFKDEQHGEIKIVYDQGLPETNRIALITTDDGGKTWVETGSLTWKDPQSFDYDKTAYFNAFAKLLEQNSSDYSQSTGTDGSQWTIETNVGLDQITITKQMGLNGKFVTRTLPYHYGFKDNQVIVQ